MVMVRSHQFLKHLGVVMERKIKYLIDYSKDRHFMIQSE